MGRAWSTDGHHVWPQYLMGADVQTVGVKERLHIAYLHNTFERPVVPAALGLSARSLAATHEMYEAREDAGTEQQFVDEIRRALSGVYTSFQSAHVVSGDFAGSVNGILSGVTLANLSTP